MTTPEKLKKKQEEYSRITAKRRKIGKKIKYMMKGALNDKYGTANLLAGEKG